jgi:hypothetical protein
MAQLDYMSDADLIRGIGEGDVAAFEALYLRYDRFVKSVISREFCGLPDRNQLTQKVADDLWKDVWKPGGCLKGHDCRRRRLALFLSFLAVRMARIHLRAQRNARRLHFEPLDDKDFAIPPADDWNDKLMEELKTVATPNELKYLVQSYDRDEPLTNQERAQRWHLIQEIKERLGNRKNSE